MITVQIDYISAEETLGRSCESWVGLARKLLPRDSSGKGQKNHTVKAQTSIDFDSKSFALKCGLELNVVTGGGWKTDGGRVRLSLVIPGKLTRSRTGHWGFCQMGGRTWEVEGRSQCRGRTEMKKV